MCEISFEIYSIVLSASLAFYSSQLRNTDIKVRTDYNLLPIIIGSRTLAFIVLKRNVLLKNFSRFQGLAVHY
jgi:hypothetical protein